MASAISKSVVVCLAVQLVLACTVEDPSPAESGGNAGSGAGGTATAAGTGGLAGSVATGGSALGGAGGSSAGTAGAPNGGAGVAGSSAGQSQGGSAGGGGVGGGGGTAGAGGTMALPFVLESPMLEHVEACTQQNHQPCMLFSKTNEMETMNGDNMSPELTWGPGPTGTLSYAITLHDFSNGFTHWAIWNIPAATLKLPANLARDSKPAVPAGAQQMSFDNNNAGYGYMGPGADDHVYELKLYALNVATFTPKTPGDQGKVYTELEANAGNFVRGTSVLRGRSKKY